MAAVKSNVLHRTNKATELVPIKLTNLALLTLHCNFLLIRH